MLNWQDQLSTIMKAPLSGALIKRPLDSAVEVQSNAGLFVSLVHQNRLIPTRPECRNHT